MAEKKRPFSAPLPLRAINDERLAGLDIRVLAAIAYHDRMSLFFGRGQGCWASHEKLAAEIGCNYINLSKSIKKLADFGYIERHQPTFADRARRHVYRIPAELYDHAESLSFGKPETRPALTEQTAEVSQIANRPPIEVCHDPSKNPAVSDEDASEYISLSDEIYFSEETENTPLKEARRALIAPGCDEFFDRNDAEVSANKAVSIKSRLGESYRSNGAAMPFRSPTANERGMELAELRAWTRAALKRLDYQYQLAEPAGIPGPVFSTFKNGKNLPEKYHAGLEQALGRLLPYDEFRGRAA